MAPNELRAEAVGFARRGAVPDRDQFHPMLTGKPHQLSNRLVPTGGVTRSAFSTPTSGDSYAN
jgi:hypothetical protein